MLRIYTSRTTSMKRYWTSTACGISTNADIVVRVCTLDITAMQLAHMHVDTQTLMGFSYIGAV